VEDLPPKNAFATGVFGTQPGVEVVDLQTSLEELDKAFEVLECGVAFIFFVELLYF
jgi:hypothetical protein